MLFVEFELRFRIWYPKCRYHSQLKISFVFYFSLSLSWWAFFYIFMNIWFIKKNWWLLITPTKIFDDLDWIANKHEIWLIDNQSQTKKLVKKKFDNCLQNKNLHVKLQSMHFLFAKCVKFFFSSKNEKFGSNKELFF